MLRAFYRKWISPFFLLIFRIIHVVYRICVRILLPVLRFFDRILCFCDKKIHGLIDRSDDLARSDKFNALSRSQIVILVLIAALLITGVIFSCRIEGKKTMLILETKKEQIEKGLYSEDIEPAYDEPDIKVGGQDEYANEMFHSKVGKRFRFFYTYVLVFLALFLFIFKIDLFKKPPKKE